MKPKYEKDGYVDVLTENGVKQVIVQDLYLEEVFSLDAQQYVPCEWVYFLDFGERRIYWIPERWIVRKSLENKSFTLKLVDIWLTVKLRIRNILVLASVYFDDAACCLDWLLMSALTGKKIKRG